MPFAGPRRARERAVAGAAFGARVASTGFEAYSEALRDHGGRWTRERLAAYLRNPGEAVPGTAMSDPRLEDPQVIGGVIDLLESLATVD